MAKHEQLAPAQTSNTTARHWLVGGLVAAMVISLLAAYFRIPGLDELPGTLLDNDLQRLYATNRDILNMAQGAEQATAADIPAWWTGLWIDQYVYYYRPLASMFIYAQYQLWGRHFSNYCLVSLFAHAVNAILLFLLVYRLSEQWGWRRATIVALLAIVIFNLRRGPVGPGWIPARVVAGEMVFWPAQVDIFSLMLALGSLLSLDLYIHRKHWGWLRFHLLLKMKL